MSLLPFEWASIIPRQPPNLPASPPSFQKLALNTMTSLTQWRAYFYSDISAQLRRHGVNQRLFDGLYISRFTHTGAWLVGELVNLPLLRTTSHTMAYTEKPVQVFKYTFILPSRRDVMFVVVQPGGFESETWKLKWHFKDGQASKWL